MIYLGADKHGLKAIQFVETYLKSHSLPYENIGIQIAEEDIPLEELVPKVAEKVLGDAQNIGILSCGTGVGVAIGANKLKGIRAILATDAKVAEWARVYDNCNVLCLAGWEVEEENIEKILDSWFSAKFDGDLGRSKMLEIFEEWR